MRFKKSYLSPNIIHLKFKRRYDITRTLLRFQEHFESPKFRGKVFSLEEFKKWYKKDRGKKKFTYYIDWDGFNFPSRVLKKFYQGEFKNLTAREKQVLQALSNDKGKFYVIGTYRSDDLRHELAHALFYVNADYRREVLKILKGYDATKINQFLKGLGYHGSVWKDECHAYLLEDIAYIKKEAKVSLNSFVKTRRKLLSVFNKYKPKDFA